MNFMGEKNSEFWEGSQKATSFLVYETAFTFLAPQRVNVPHKVEQRTYSKPTLVPGKNAFILFNP